VDGLPFSQACENNKQAILDVIQPLLVGTDAVLEIGSGTAQHAAFFAAAMPWLQWQPTELGSQLDLARPRCDAYPGENLLQPVALDVTEPRWPLTVPAVLYTANTLHIMPWSAVECLFAALHASAPPNFLLLVYGPFNYGGEYTSDSNERFDGWLKERDPLSGIRDFEAVDSLASAAGLALTVDNAMPANNRLIVWRSA